MKKIGIFILALSATVLIHAQDEQIVSASWYMFAFGVFMLIYPYLSERLVLWQDYKMVRTKLRQVAKKYGLKCSLKISFVIDSTGTGFHLVLCSFDKDAKAILPFLAQVGKETEKLTTKTANYRIVAHTQTSIMDLFDIPDKQVEEFALDVYSGSSIKYSVGSNCSVGLCFGVDGKALLLVKIWQTGLELKQLIEYVKDFEKTANNRLIQLIGFETDELPVLVVACKSPWWQLLERKICGD